MAPPIAIYVEIVVILCTIYAIITTVIAYARHRQKKTQLTKTIILMLFFWTLAILTFNGKMLCVIFDVTEGPIYLFFITTPQHLLFIGLYFMFGFVRIVFLGEGTDIGKLTKLVAILIGGNIILGIIRDFTSLYTPELTVVRDILGILVSLIVALPTLLGALKLRRKVAKDNPHQSQLLNIAIMAVAYLGMVVSLIVENLIWQSLSSEYQPNEASFVMWVMIVIMLYAIYNGFFATKTKSPE